MQNCFHPFSALLSAKRTTSCIEVQRAILRYDRVWPCSFKQLMTSDTGSALKCLRRHGNAPVRKLVAQRLSPFSQASFASVNFLPTADKRDDYRPFIAIH